MLDLFIYTARNIYLFINYYYIIICYVIIYFFSLLLQFIRSPPLDPRSSSPYATPSSSSPSTSAHSKATAFYFHYSNYCLFDFALLAFKNTYDNRWSCGDYFKVWARTK